MELIFTVLSRNMFNTYKVNLSRFDLCYFRKSKATDQKDDLEFFMEKHLLNQNEDVRRTCASWGRNSKGLLLKIGSRTNSNHYRVYETTE